MEEKKEISQARWGGGEASATLLSTSVMTYTFRETSSPDHVIGSDDVITHVKKIILLQKTSHHHLPPSCEYARFIRAHKI